MPTGYTAKLMEKGESFEEFIMSCARAFGACITLRDESHDVPIPDEFKPSDYYKTHMAERATTLAQLEAMTNEERIRFGVSTRDSQINNYREYLQRHRDENVRLLEMRSKVLAWNPPSSDHVELKNFMLQQIEVSTDTGDYWEKALADVERAEPYEFYAKAVEEARHGVEYAKEEYAKELERVAGRNKWIRQLRESLK
jgi:hypothetical protein